VERERYGVVLGVGAAITDYLVWSWREMGYRGKREALALQQLRRVMC
jgi:hypothetical protein